MSVSVRECVFGMLVYGCVCMVCVLNHIKCGGVGAIISKT